MLTIFLRHCALLLFTFLLFPLGRKTIKLSGAEPMRRHILKDAITFFWTYNRCVLTLEQGRSFYLPFIIDKNCWHNQVMCSCY